MNPPCNRKGRDGNPPPKGARASALPDGRYKGSVYLAANWIAVGVTKGYARSNGKYTNKHGVKKKMLVYPLQADARELLRDPQNRPEWHRE